MKENIDINEIAALAKLSLSENERVRATEEMLEFTKYMQILEAYCGEDNEDVPSYPSPYLREDTVRASNKNVLDGYVTVPLTVGGEE